LMLGSLRAAQAMSLLLVTVAIVGLALMARKK
jgi:hypothetical protein